MGTGRAHASQCARAKRHWRTGGDALAGRDKRNADGLSATRATWGREPCVESRQSHACSPRSLHFGAFFWRSVLLGAASANPLPSSARAGTGGRRPPVGNYVNPRSIDPIKRGEISPLSCTSGWMCAAELPQCDKQNMAGDAGSCVRLFNNNLIVIGRYP